MRRRAMEQTVVRAPVHDGDVLRCVGSLTNGPLFDEPEHLDKRTLQQHSGFWTRVQGGRTLPAAVHARVRTLGVHCGLEEFRRPSGEFVGGNGVSDDPTFLRSL